MELVPRNLAFPFLLFIIVNLPSAIDSGFDGEILPYLYSGYQQLGLGDRCASTSQCANRYCCVGTGFSHPTCQPFATIGRRCSRRRFGNIYRRFCPCVDSAYCNQRRICERMSN
ncbi:hypothetical protein MTO96_035052 [Rhipicephalus appendiculatus]|uniref:Ixodegrin B n=1 Tax=Rhipicephalus appendiculatus TaxID=34631 RepID=A0A131Z350_RHIAP